MSASTNFTFHTPTPTQPLPCSVTLLQSRMVEDRNREILALCDKYALPAPRSLAAGG